MKSKKSKSKKGKNDKKSNIFEESESLNDDAKLLN